MKNHLGLATVGLVTIKKDVINCPDFLAGKAGDPAAADRIVEQIWSDKKTDQLRGYLSNDSVFLTVPSTTRTNVIPIQLAQFLSRETGTPWAIGDEIFKTKHKIASKHISRNKRAFQSRKFEIKDKESVKIFRKYKVVIVDDILTSGGSVREYAEFLRDQKINVAHVVVMMGDRRFEIDKKTEDKLKKLLTEKNIGIDFESINYLTRTEAGGLIQLLNSARSENAKCKLTEQLQRIQRFGVVRNFERTPRARRDKSVGRKDSSNGRTCERVSAYTSPSGPKGVEWEIEFYRGTQPVKKETKILSGNLTKKEQQEQLRALSCQIASAHDLGSVQVKFTRTRKKINIEPQKEKRLDRGR